MGPLLAALLISSGTAALRWEHRAVVEAPLETSLELAFDDPAPFFGPEVHSEDGRDRVLESRLALAQRLGGWLLSASATLSTNLKAGMETDFGYSAGRSWTAAAIALGFEAFGGTGDTHAFLEPPGRHHYLAPVLAWSLAPDWAVRFQVAKRTSGGSSELVRLQIAYGF